MKCCIKSYLQLSLDGVSKIVNMSQSNIPYRIKKNGQEMTTHKFNEGCKTIILVTMVFIGVANTVKLIHVHIIEDLDLNKNSFLST